MANIAVISIAALAIVWGLQPTLGVTLVNPCNASHYRTCYDMISERPCPRRDDIIDCFNDIKTQCDDASVQNTVNYILRMQNHYKNECPGLLNGECYDVEEQKCLRQISVVEISKPVSDKRVCPYLKKNIDVIDKCLNNLKTKCTSYLKQLKADWMISDVRKYNANCENLSNSNMP